MLRRHRHRHAIVYNPYRYNLTRRCTSKYEENDNNMLII